MGCCHHYQFSAGGDDLFTVDVNRIRFGPGALRELGAEVVLEGVPYLLIRLSRSSNFFRRHCNHYARPESRLKSTMKFGSNRLISHSRRPVSSPRITILMDLYRLEVGRSSIPARQPTCLVHTPPIFWPT